MNRSFWLFTRLRCWECNSYLGSFFLIAHSRAITHATSCLLLLHKPCLFVLYFSNVPNHQRSVQVSQVWARSLMKWRNKHYPAPTALCPRSARCNLTKGFPLALSGSSPLRREFLQAESCKQSQHFMLAALGQKTNWFKAQLEQGWGAPLSLQAELGAEGRAGKRRLQAEQSILQHGDIATSRFVLSFTEGLINVSSLPSMICNFLRWDHGTRISESEGVELHVFSLLKGCPHGSWWRSETGLRRSQSFLWSPKLLTVLTSGGF